MVTPPGAALTSRTWTRNPPECEFSFYSIFHVYWEWQLSLDSTASMLAAVPVCIS